MKFASTRLVVADMKAMVSFYERVTEQTADWLAPVFAEIVLPGAVLAFNATQTEPPGAGAAGANRTACIEFQVDDIDAHYARLKDTVPIVQDLMLMPWGNKRFMFRDPEGTIVSLYAPATDDARKRFGAR